MAKKKAQSAELNLGPVLFHWNEDRWRDFYFEMADEAPVDTVFIGENVCAKRAAFTMPLFEEVTERLERAGKTVIFSTLGEVAVPIDRKLSASVSAMEDHMVEANDASALLVLSGRDHAIGPLLNVYNEEALRALAKRGAKRVSLNAEIRAKNLPALCSAAADAGVRLETQVFGRTSLALSARCYHARAHGRIKDNCQFVCENDPDGMTLNSVDGSPVLAINGIQTMTRECIELSGEMGAMAHTGIGAFRVSPHSHDMLAVVKIYRAVLEGKMEPRAAHAKIAKLYPEMDFTNGFYHGRAGFEWVEAA